jgi:flagellar basal-body rod protein FlgG
MSSSVAQERRLETIMNNIANLETVGFRKDHSIFEVVPFSVAKPGVERFDHMRFQTAGVVVHAEPDLSPGRLRRTENLFDLAINGEGYFVVETGEGPRYTRAGQVTTDKNGVLITTEGLPLLGQNGRITLPPGELVVLEDGKVGVKPPGKGKNTVVDMLQLVALDAKVGVTRVGTTLLDGTPTDVRPTGSIMQGFREDSNVNPFYEITAMIDALRAYEAAQKLITTLDEATGKAISDIGGT